LLNIVLSTFGPNAKKMESSAPLRTVNPVSQDSTADRMPPRVAGAKSKEMVHHVSIQYLNAVLVRPHNRMRKL
jgi:hypothetical protein